MQLEATTFAYLHLQVPNAKLTKYFPQFNFVLFYIVLYTFTLLLFAQFFAFVVLFHECPLRMSFLHICALHQQPCQRRACLCAEFIRNVYRIFLFIAYVLSFSVACSSLFLFGLHLDSLSS